MEIKKIRLDEKGHEEYLNKIEQLRKEITNNTRAKSDACGNAIGDSWHDNAEYDIAKQRENGLLHDLEEMLNNLPFIEIIESSDDKSKINVGDIVKVKTIYAPNDVEEDIYKLIGGTAPSLLKKNGDIKEITLNSPLGSAIYQKSVNDVVPFKLPNNTVVDVVILENISRTLEEAEQAKLQEEQNSDEKKTEQGQYTEFEQHFVDVMNGELDV